MTLRDRLFQKGRLAALQIGEFPKALRDLGFEDWDDYRRSTTTMDSLGRPGTPQVRQVDGKLVIGSLGSGASKGDGPSKEEIIIENAGHRKSVPKPKKAKPKPPPPAVAGMSKKKKNLSVASLSKERASLLRSKRREVELKDIGDLNTAPVLGANLDAKRLARLQALQLAYPSEVDYVVPPPFPSNGPPPPRTARRCTYKYSPPVVQSGTDYFSGIFAAGPFWQNKYKIIAGMTGNAFSSLAVGEEPLYSSLGSSTDGVQCGGMCVHVLNMTAIQNCGGTVIFGSIPASLVTTTLTWDLLFAYRETQLKSFSEQQDYCHKWTPGPADVGRSAPTSTYPTDAGNNVLFCVWKAAASQSVVLCFDTCYGIFPTAAGAMALGPVRWPQDDEEYQKSVTIAIPPNEVPQPTTKAETESGFAATLKKLGMSLADTVVPGLGSLVEKGWDWVSSWFSSRKLHQLVVQLSLGIEPEAVKDAVRRGTMPAEYAHLLLQLAEWTIHTRDPMLRYTHVSGAVYEYRPATTTLDEFGIAISHPAVTCLRPGDETRAEGLDFAAKTLVELKTPEFDAPPSSELSPLAEEEIPPQSRGRAPIVGGPAIMVRQRTFSAGPR